MPSTVERLLIPFVAAALAGCATHSVRDRLPDETVMKRVTDAATPGPEHAWLAADAGRWVGTSRSWPGAGAEPIIASAECTVTMLLGGRFAQTCHSSELPGMGRFEGIVITGYDNAAGEFQSTWIDCYGTTTMSGTGRWTADGRGIEIAYAYFCPIRRARVGLRETITRDSPDRQTHRMWSEDLASGEEYLMMEAVYTRAH